MTTDGNGIPCTTNDAHTSPPPLVKRTVPQPSPLYRVFWRFAAERQRIYMLRAAGEHPPWTSDDVLAAYKFTNTYRAADRVSQYLIRTAYSDPGADPDTVFLRTILFKIFNKIETWEEIVRRLGPPEAAVFDFDECDALLFGLRRRRVPIYSGAYIMPSGGKSGMPKHRMHLRLIRSMLDADLPERLAATAALSDAYQLLRGWPTLGPFLAYQYAIDLNYTTLMNHSEMDFVVAGPGALDGLFKCFISFGDYTPAEVIRWLTDIQETEFDRLELEFPNLWGRALQPIDIQNLFCEVSKYTRVSHPDVKGIAGRSRIKCRFKMTEPLMEPFFPPKWGLNQKIKTWKRAQSTRVRSVPCNAASDDADSAVA